jgi:cytochrome P450
MALYPEAQRKAQQELDALAKPGHLPIFEDAENFPYITAVVQEVLRWSPIVPLGECRLHKSGSLTWILLQSVDECFVHTDHHDGI